MKLERLSLPFATTPAIERRELETLFLASFAAIPLYLTGAISPLPLTLFHGVMVALGLALFRSNNEPLVGAPTLRFLAVGYLFIYLVDAFVISRSAIRSSTHLLLFIAVYQAVEAQNRLRTIGAATDERKYSIDGAGYRHQLGRLLVIVFLFVASVANATHQSVMIFVLAIAVLLFRHLIELSRVATSRHVRVSQVAPDTGRTAVQFVVAATAGAMLLFPLLPRVRSPFVPGFAGALQSASTGLSDTIDFNNQRSISSDPLVVARVWMRQDAIALFTPLRLRGRTYDDFRDGVWIGESRNELVPQSPEGSRIATAVGISRDLTIQQKLLSDSRLLIPVGTHTLVDAPRVREAPSRDVYRVARSGSGIINYQARISRTVTPLEPVEPGFVDYPISPQVEAFARSIIGSSTAPLAKSAKIEAFLSGRFRYVPDPASIGRQLSVDEFLLRERRGHCEYFAAGMVVLLKAVGVQSRIVGGFYGGKLNPLTGYFVVRKSDAHAWVEILDGGKWVTFDPTPASLRPGTAASGLFSAYMTAIGDSISYFWDRYVLTFGLVDQIAIVAAFFVRTKNFLVQVGSGGLSTLRFLMGWNALIALGLALALGLVISRVRRSRRSLFGEMVVRLRQRGIEVDPAMTSGELAVMLRERHPLIAERLAPIIELYERQRFAGIPVAAERIAAARESLASLEA
ncbi:MAG TPA: transglutaminaseTgpA domain-containing protein [Thermoanaerobaculia bacterium]|nr:transglutaminaseTgpA domain-containing protein [Thermoanaerobaculia bacterium]